MSVDWKEVMTFVVDCCWKLISISSCNPHRCLFSRLDIVNIQFLSIKHEQGGSVAIAANEQAALNPENYRAKLMGKQGQLGMRLPPHFFNGITGETKGKALAVLTLDRKCKMSNGSNITETDYTEVGK